MGQSRPQDTVWVGRGAAKSREVSRREVSRREVSLRSAWRVDRRRQIKAREEQRAAAINSPPGSPSRGFAGQIDSHIVASSSWLITIASLPGTIEITPSKIMSYSTSA